MNFLCDLIAWSFVISPFASRCASSRQAVAKTWPLGDNFTLSNGSGTQLEIKGSGGKIIWKTTSDGIFLSASAGNDSVVGSNGAFNISQVDSNVCQGQNISAIHVVPWNISASETAVQITGHLLNCGSVTATAYYALTIWPPSDHPDRVAFYINIDSPSGLSQPLKKLYFRFASHAQEDIYGFGAQASFASLKNQSVPIFSREQGVGRGDEPITSIENSYSPFSGGNRFTTYTAIPSFVTTDARLFYLSEKSTGYANFDLTRPDEVVIRYDSLSVDGAFMRAGDMFGAVEALTAYTGRMPALPDWVDTGAILGIQGGQAKVERIVDQGFGYRCPIAAVWLQDWCGTHSQVAPYVNVSRLWWNWENDRDLYPTWNDFVQGLRKRRNVRTLSYINVFLANVSTKADGFKKNLFAEADKAHYLVQNTTTNSTAIISSGPGLDAGIIDLTNPQLVSWFTDVLRMQVWNANISGFMSDFGEYTPVTADTKLYSMVSDAFFAHNLYPLQWTKYQRDVINQLGKQNEALVFHRSAAMGSNRYMNLFWVGDQNVDWGLNDGIKSVVTIMMHMGLSGYAHQHSDIGGYTDSLTFNDYNVTRSAELLGRWGELAAVSSAVFRSHEGNIPSVNAQFYSNSSTYDYFAYNARMFVSLAAYRRKVLQTECATKGWPLLRPPVMYHPDDIRARNISYQSFYLGHDLYIAPVLDPKTFELDVYLPKSNEFRTYEHVWTGQIHAAGGSVKVSTPYGKPAVFIVNGVRTPELQSFLDFVRTEANNTIQVE